MAKVERRALPSRIVDGLGHPYNQSTRIVISHLGDGGGYMSIMLLKLE